VGLGVRGKLYRVREPYTAMGWALDPAVLVATDPIRVGLLVENLYSEPIAFGNGHVEKWETSLRVGAGVCLKVSEKVRWNAVFEASGLFAANPQLAGGVEAWVGGLGARVGANSSGPAIGLTVQFANFHVDWACAPHIDLGATHRISVAFLF